MLTIQDLLTEAGRARLEYLVQIKLYQTVFWGIKYDLQKAFDSASNTEEKETSAHKLNMVDEALENADRHYVLALSSLQVGVTPINELSFYDEVSAKMNEMFPISFPIISDLIVKKIQLAPKIASIILVPHKDVINIKAKPSGAESHDFLQQLIRRLKRAIQDIDLEYRIDFDPTGMTLSIVQPMPSDQMLSIADYDTVGVYFRTSIAQRILNLLRDECVVNVETNILGIVFRTARSAFSFTNEFNGTQANLSSQHNDENNLPLIRAEEQNRGFGM